MSRGDAYIGLMSGTSLDGISACVIRFAENGKRTGGRDAPAAENRLTAENRQPTAAREARGAENSLSFELLAFEVTEYNSEQRDHLLRAMKSATAQEYCRLDFDLGGWLADAAGAVLMESGVPRDEVRAIGSHGQTLWHEPLHSTWQIGQSAVIAERLGIDVVSDFRVRDVAAGGHGAPLVSMADAMIFSANHWRALQNIGGIGNVTVVPPGGTFEAVRAFDTGPGNSVIDMTVKLLRPELHYDRDGKLADLLASHPPINRRIMLLYQMAGLSHPLVQGAKVQMVQ